MPPSADQLHVISVIFNPLRAAARRPTARLVAAHQEQAGVTRYLVEATFGERAPELAHAGDPRHLVLRSDDELWLKENLINIAVRELLPQGWRYMMWMDADFTFARPDWAHETVEALQHWRVVQPFSHAIDLGPEHELIEVNTGFAYLYNCGLDVGRCGEPGYPFPHPGYCWAWRRDAWDAVGGMIERAAGSFGDYHMAAGLIGRPDLSMPLSGAGMHPNYLRMIEAWTRRAEIGVQRDIGHVAGAILHRFHGWKTERNYGGFWDIFRGAAYDPDSDLVADARGLLHLNPDPGEGGRRVGLRDALRRHFRGRREDAGPREWPVRGLR